MNFRVIKPQLGRTHCTCMDQSKDFCPRNFDKTVSKIHLIKSKTSCRILGFFSVGTRDDGHEDNRQTVRHTHELFEYNVYYHLNPIKLFH